MSVVAAIVDGPLPARVDAVGAPDAGAVVVFDGVVRAIEGDRVLEALEYTAYEPMASHELLQLAEATVARYGLLTLATWHSRGRVAVGETSFRLVIAATHRREALDAMDDFINRMKRDVPIWKRPIFLATIA